MIARGTLAIILGLLMGLVIGQLMTPSLEVPPSSSARDRSTEGAAVAFYAAMNRYLELGDPALLDGVLDSGFVDHSAIGPDQDAEGLVRYLSAMRATYPDMRMNVAGMTPRDDVVAVAVATTGGTAAIAQSLIPDRAPSHSGYEQLRILNGKVAERWASQTLPPQHELVASMELGFMTGWFIQCTMEQLVLTPDASLPQWHHAPTLLIASSGTVAIEINPRDPAASPDPPLLLSGDFATPTALQRGAWFELGAESVILLPEDERYRIWNTSQQPATVIVVSTQQQPPSVVFDSSQSALADPNGDAHGPSSVGLLPMGTDPDRPYTLSLVRIAAAPGEHLPSHEVDGLEQLLVAAGALDVELHMGNLVFTGPDVRTMVSPGDRRQLLPGERITAESGAHLSYQVTGDQPATIWFVQLVRAPAPGA